MVIYPSEENDGLICPSNWCSVIPFRYYSLFLISIPPPLIFDLIVICIWLFMLLH
jgi:hypothetical protein